jgi:serpin B
VNVAEFPLSVEPFVGDVIVADRVLHRAVAEVNEEGTEAAAATAVFVPLSAERFNRPPRLFRMIADHPFFVMIRDETTRTILFMGWVGDPAAGLS